MSSIARLTCRTAGLIFANANKSSNSVELKLLIPGTGMTMMGGRGGETRQVG